jgi:hypothetical protein
MQVDDFWAETLPEIYRDVIGAMVKDESCNPMGKRMIS